MQRAAQRAQAAACMPRLPGPLGRQSDDSPPQGPPVGPLRAQTSVSERGAAFSQTAPWALPSPMPHVSDLPKLTVTADILVVGVGYPHLVKADWVKPGAVVIDVGINVVDGLPEVGGQGQDGQQHHHDGRAAPGIGGSSGVQGGAQHASSGMEWGNGEVAPFQVVGDVDFEGVSVVASAITPVPGGVGPMTVAAVLHNTVQAARERLMGRGGVA
jgi:hypothetical protein